MGQYYCYYKLLVTLFICVVCLFVNSECKFKVISAGDPIISELTTTSTSKPRSRCGCKGLPGAPVCANNGVQYKNLCAFECVQKNNHRLQIIKQGSCAGLNRQDYYQRPSSMSRKT